MGNHRFKLSNMMPNAWFYKLRDMNKPRNQNTSNTTKKRFPSLIQNPRKSFYPSSESIQSENFYTSPKNMKVFDTQFPPRISSKTKTRRKTIYKPSPTKTNPSVCVCYKPEYPVWLKPGTMQAHDNCRSPLDYPTSPDQDSLSSEYEYLDSLDEPHEDGIDSWSRSSSFKLSSDIIIDMKNTQKAIESELISELGLRPILTKPSQHNVASKSQPKQKTKTSSSPASRKSFSRNPRVKIRNKLTSKRNESTGRKSMKGEKKSMFYSESFAVVKASFDPEQDFRESMMEMIVENNIRASKDLEELLACYLSLNSNKYHDLIIKAFEQIWFTMPLN